MRDVPRRPSNWRNQVALPEWLRERGIVAIADIDTRKLTRLLRDRGAMNGALMAARRRECSTPTRRSKPRASSPASRAWTWRRKSARASAIRWREGQLDLDSNVFVSAPAKFKVVAYDFGVKHNILRMLAERGCDVTVVPAQTPAGEVLAMKPDGMFLSNGPGDPAPCDYAIAAIRDVHRPQDADLRHLPRPPVARPRRRREDA